jgi:hypothetical protein
MRIWNLCFIVGALAALGGMSLGIFMGISQDFSLTPAHAHLNLLGWVTMSLYGLYYRGAPSAVGRLAWVQVGAAILGFPAMTGGLTLMLSGIVSHEVAEPLIVAGSLLTIGAMACFLAILVRQALREGRLNNA